MRLGQILFTSNGQRPDVILSGNLLSGLMPPSILIRQFIKEELEDCSLLIVPNRDWIWKGNGLG